MGDQPALNNQKILEVNDLHARFNTNDCIIYAVNGVSFDLNRGEMLGIVGESGSGKSVSVKSLLGLIPTPPGEISSGTAIFNNNDLLKCSEEEIRKIRGQKIGFIFQDPMTSLNPVLTIGKQITEPMISHLGMSKSEAQDRAVHLLNLIGFPKAETQLNDYPHQFSGGMRQRVMIAISLSCTPQILIADEPTTALDVTIQAQIIDVIKDLRNEFDMSIIWITHDLGVIAGIADRVLVMYGGCIVEQAPVDELYANPSHPYTQGLLGSLPKLSEEREDRLANIRGQPPIIISKLECCPFSPRCPYVFDKCYLSNPQLYPVASSHDVACWRE